MNMAAMTIPTAHPPLRSPRDYCVAILAEPSRERRNQLLAQCPEHWRELVRENVQSAFARIKAYRQYQDRRDEAAKEPPPPAPRREDTTFRVSDFTKSTPEVGSAHLSALRAAVARPEGVPHV